MWRRWHTTQNFCLPFMNDFEKQLFIKKTVGQKNLKILIFIMLYFFKENKEKHLEISLFYTCAANILMIWSTVPEIYSPWMWQVGIGNYGLSFLRFYIPSPIKSWKIRILKKWKKLLEISSFYTCVPKTTIIRYGSTRYGSWDMQWDRQNVLSFWANFSLLTP